MRIVLASLVALGILSGAAACSGKALEPYKDAPVNQRDKSAADVYTMPDGFSNFSSKCDLYGNRVYVAFHGDSPYAAITVVPQDPSCKR
jgi:hypothetical protein